MAAHFGNGRKEALAQALHAIPQKYGAEPTLAMAWV
jgi:hypothetical protein